MKNVLLWIFLVIGIMSCKDSNETTLPNDSSSQSSSVENTTDEGKTTADTEASQETINIDKKENRSAVQTIQQDLVAFNGIQALSYLKLEGIRPGMDEVDLKDINIKANQNMESAVRRTGDGDFSVYQIQIGGVPMVELYPVAGQVMDVSFINERATPPKMIGIGNTYAELLSVYPDVKAIGSVIESRVTVQINGTVFLLDCQYSKPEPFDTPLDSKIKWISFR